MAIIQLVLALIVLTILYKRMIDREVPNPIGLAQAIVPVILGVVSLPVSFVLFLGIGSMFVQLGISFQDMNELVRSAVRAFFIAGFPEEIAKFSMIMITILIFRSKIKNVYEYILIGAGVGFGFTLLEEFFYGSDGVSALLRILTIAAHMIFGIYMAKHLGLAKYKKAHGESGVGLQYVLALVVPIAIHTIFDTFTGNNAFLSSEDDTMQVIGMVLALVWTLGFMAFQFVLFSRLKKNAEKYSNMTF